jgi:PKD repeat protein
VAPSVGAGPDKTSLWGIPVPFHANGSDAGSIDNGSLQYSWDFDDLASPVGGVGQDVSHTFANPGVYMVEVTVTDKDGAIDTDTVMVAVAKRDTTAAYSGPVQSTPSKIVTLTGSLTDELGQPVAGRTVTFALGAQSGTGVTNSAGIASTSFKLNQKQGTYAVSMTFIGDAKYQPSSTATTFTIGK